MNIKFGTEGWRGVISDDFTFRNVALVTQAVADYLDSVRKKGDRKLVTIGYDNRFMSESFAAVCADIFGRNGYSPMLSGVPVTTPNVCQAIRANDAPLGIMVTASHNPPRFNGLKVKAPYGGPVPDWVSSEIEKRIPEAARKLSGYSGTPRSEKTDLRRGYIDYVRMNADLGRIRKLKKKIVFDYMHGSGSGYLQNILKGSNIIGIRDTRDALFGGVNPEPIAENLQALRKEVIRSGASAGIALDGDGDRVGVVDDRGKYLPPQTVFPLFLYYLTEYGKKKGRVIQTISLGYLSERIAAAHGLPLEEVPVGFKYVCERILKGDVLLGGEESGGYRVRGEVPDRDGMLCGMVILEMLASTGKKLSGLVKEMKRKYGESAYFRQDLALPKVIFDRKDFSARIKDNLPSKLLGRNIKDIRSYDGVKIVLSDDSWLLLRPSGTEPKMRVYSETPSAAFTKKVIEWGVKFTLKHM